MRPFNRVKMLNADEYRVLKAAVAHRKTPAGKARRAKIVLLSNQRHTTREITAKLDCNERTTLKWIGCFNRHGVAGLEEGPREGRPRVYGPEDVGTVIQAALTPPQELGLPFASWTLDRLVAYLKEEKGVGMGRTRVAEMLSNEGLRWRKKEKWFGERVDPEFAEKRAIERLYAYPPADSVVLCVDEMGPLSARSYPGRELVPRLEQGRAGRAKQELELDRNRRMGGYVFGGFRPTTGEALTATYESRSIVTFLDFLEKVEEWVPEGVDRVYAIMDNLRAHRAYDVLLFSLARPRWEFVFQPKYAAYLNLIGP